jgi:hypothetical protein
MTGSTNFRMIETSAVFKLPVFCRACGSQQYETLLRISNDDALVCVECQHNIDPSRDDPAIFARAVSFVEWERGARHRGAGRCLK